MLVEVANELFAAGKYEAALSSYDDAIKLAPNAPEVHCNRGAALRSVLQMCCDAVLVRCSTALRVTPRRAWVCWLVQQFGSR
jgi:hypothetical protein